MTIDQPGIYTIPAAEYHADPAPAPSLSASIATALLTYSPLHAWTNHPRLNPAFRREDEQKFDLGSAAHAHLLEGATGSAFAIVDADTWQTKAAQGARAAARLAGKIPLLAEQWTRVQAMATAARQQCGAHESPVPLTHGQPERTLLWREGGIWCRARLDWLHDDRRTVDDYKTTSASANPDGFSRTVFSMGYDLQAAFYLRGLQAVCGIEATFRFVVQETFPPYALSVIGLGPDALVLAQKKVLLALELWTECLRRNRWPAYPRRVCWVELPPWLEARWLEREMRPQEPDDGRPIGDLLAGMGDLKL